MERNETIQNNNNYIHHLNLFSVKHTIKEKQNKNIYVSIHTSINIVHSKK